MALAGGQRVFYFTDMIDFFEKDLEDIIYESGLEKLREKGLILAGVYNPKKFRQLKIGKYGIPDIVYYQRHEDCHQVTILELKRGKIDLKAYAQAKRYEEGIRKYFKLKNCAFPLYIDIVLIGSSNEERDDWPWVLNSDRSTKVFLYKYGIDGIEFHHVGEYYWHDNGFGDVKKLGNYQDIPF